MRFPRTGTFTLTTMNNVMEVYATGAWDMPMAEELFAEMTPLAQSFNGKPWGALIDGRRWILSTPECQERLATGILLNIDYGLRRAAYVLDTAMIKRAQIERTHPERNRSPVDMDYQRNYFQDYFSALAWLRDEGYSPFPDD